MCAWWRVPFDVLCCCGVCVYRGLGLLDGYTDVAYACMCVYAFVAQDAGLVSETAYSG